VDTKEIFDLLSLQFENSGLEFFPQEKEGGDTFVKIPSEFLVEVAQFTKDDPRLDFKMCHCVSGVDYGDHLCSVIHLYSLQHKHKLVLKTECSTEDPVIPSVSEVWKAANWHERESFDLVGITYLGHPNLRRILLSDDWEGHPLRKDYQMPDDSLFPWEDGEEEEAKARAEGGVPQSPEG
jgi:NADH-quinone oxidoreductase subunit C